MKLKTWSKWISITVMISALFIFLVATIIDYKDNYKFYSVCKKLALGEEMNYTRENELKIVREMYEITKQVAMKQFSGAFGETDLTGKRFVNPADETIYGCLNAKFTVNLEDSSLNYGMFTPKKQYDVLLRFTRRDYGHSDWYPKILGIHMRFFGISGTLSRSNSLLGYMGNVQDFLFHAEYGTISSPKHYVEMHQSTVHAESETAETFKWYLKHPFLYWDWIHAHNNGGASTSFTETLYNTGIASKWKNSAAKFHIKPCRQWNLVPTDYSEDIRYDILQQLAYTDVCFDFYVQIQKDSCLHPIDMISKYWTEHSSPLLKLGRIIIPKNTILFTQNKCLNFQFVPCQGLTDHKPLGIMGRAYCSLYSNFTRWQSEENMELGKTVDLEPVPRAFCLKKKGRKGIVGY